MINEITIRKVENGFIADICQGNSNKESVYSTLDQALDFLKSKFGPTKIIKRSKTNRKLSGSIKQGRLGSDMKIKRGRGRPRKYA